MAEENGDPRDTRPPLIVDLAPDAPQTSTGDTFDGLAMPAAAAAVGGVLGLALSLVFAGIGVWPSAAPASGDAAEIGRLRTELAAARADTEKLSTRLGELTAAPKPAAATAAPTADDGRVAALAERVSQQEKALADLKSQSSTGAPAAMPDPRLEQFGADLAALRAAVQPVASLADRVAKLDGDLAALKPAADAAKPLPEAVAALDGRFAKLETTTTDLMRQTAALTSRVDDAMDRVAAATKSRSEAVLALTLANLKTAVDSGRPFATELAVASNLMSAEELQPLAAFAEAGVAPLSRLAEAFPALARRIGEAEAAKRAGGGSLVDKLVAQAKQSVTIRPVDEAAGTSVPARLTRIEAALNAGRAAEALADWQALPEAARALNPQFDAQLAARTRVDALLSTTTRTALDRLAGRAP
jgi:hypothetical protein